LPLDDDLRDELLPEEVLRDEPPPDDDALFDLLRDEVVFDLPLDEPALPLFDPPELFDELERPLPPDDFDEPLDFRPEDEDDEDDLDRPDELEERPPEVDFEPPLLERDDELLPLDDRPPLLEADERPRPDEVIVSDAAPIAPMAAPDAAPVIISPAKSMTLSTIADVVLFEPDDLPRDEVDEDDELSFREPLDRVLFAI
jgi:hypothetical protein